MRSFLLCVVLFHLLPSALDSDSSAEVQLGRQYTPEDLDWQDSRLNNFEEEVGSLFDPYGEKDSSSSEDEEPVGTLELDLSESTFHVMENDDDLFEYAVGDSHVTPAEDSSDDSEEPPELDDEDMQPIDDEEAVGAPEETEMEMSLLDPDDEPQSPELDELAQLFFDRSDEEEVSSDSDDLDDNFLRNLVGAFDDDDDSEEAVGDFIDEEFETAVSSSDSEDYDEADLPVTIEDDSEEIPVADEEFDSADEELVGSGVPEGLFFNSGDGLEDEEFAVGEVPDYLLESSESDSSEESVSDSQEYMYDDGDFEALLGDDEEEDDESDVLDDFQELPDFDEIAVGELNDYGLLEELDSDELDALFEVAVGDDLDMESEDSMETEDIGELPEYLEEAVGDLYDSEEIDELPDEEEAVGELDANGWAILDAPPYTKAKNYESDDRGSSADSRQARHRSHRSRRSHRSHRSRRSDREREVNEDDRSYYNDRLSREEQDYRRQRRERRREYRHRSPRYRRSYHRHRPHERIRTYIDNEDDLESAVGEYLASVLGNDYRRRLQDSMDDGSLEDHLKEIHRLHEEHKRLMALKQQHELNKKEAASKPDVLTADISAPHKELHDIIMFGDQDAKKKEEADKSKAEAEKQKADAQKQKEEAERQKADAESQRAEAERQKAEA